jgi:hypothetical protein
LRVLGQGEAAASALVICSHGDENGFVFGDYASKRPASLETSVFPDEPW